MRLANGMALGASLFSSEVVAASEFPQLAHAHNVEGVPRTVVNRAGAFVGALPELDFVEAVLRLPGVDPAPVTAEGELD